MVFLLRIFSLSSQSTFVPALESDFFLFISRFCLPVVLCGHLGSFFPMERFHYSPIIAIFPRGSSTTGELLHPIPLYLILEIIWPKFKQICTGGNDFFIPFSSLDFLHPTLHFGLTAKGGLLYYLLL